MVPPYPACTAMKRTTIVPNHALLAVETAGSRVGWQHSSACRALTMRGQRATPHCCLSLTSKRKPVLCLTDWLPLYVGFYIVQQTVMACQLPQWKLGLLTDSR